MRTEYDPNLIEQTVFLLAQKDSKIEREIHTRIDPLYSLPTGPEREREFRTVFASLFERLGADSGVRALLAEYPIIERNVEQCIMREAPRRRAEQAELFVTNGEREAGRPKRTLIIEACPSSLIEPKQLAGWLRRELLHVSDMLDERFGYSPDLLDGPPSRQNLVRDRYRVLWDVFVEGRLYRDGLSDGKGAPKLLHAFRRVFEGWDLSDRRAFDRVLLATDLTHQRLLDWAYHPETLFGSGIDRRGRTGEPCPLCRFPTSDWFVFDDDVDTNLVRAIGSSFPNWTPAHGACRQCVEIYGEVARNEAGILSQRQCEHGEGSVTTQSTNGSER